MSVTERTAYTTNDGKVFLYEGDAEEHDLNRVRELLDLTFGKKLLETGRFTNRDVFIIITTLFDDYDSSEELVEKLYKILD